MKKDLLAARRLYKSFREREPTRVKPVRVTLPKALAVIGHCDFIGYTTTHGGKATRYKHDFARGSRPLLCVGAKTGQLYLLQGRFRFTARGIVDLDPRRRELK